jgi:tetratricopeptide (TPR) repeat protein
MMGTVAYMSPEQVRGEDLDTRTDIFSFGIVLYEMATAQQAFQGHTTGVVSEAILNRAPAPLRRLVSYDGLELERIVTKALQKDRNLRYQTAADLRSDLLAYKSNVDAGRATKTSLTKRLAVFPKRWIARIGAAVVSVGLVAAAWLLYPRHAHALKSTDTVILADFTNTTGDPVFDGTLRQGLASQLEQSPFLTLLSDERIAQTLTLMTKPEDSRLTHQLARDVCQRTGSKAIIEGSISALGSQYALHLKAVDCLSADVLVESLETANGREQVIPVLSEAATKMREKLGESLATVRKYDIPAENVTTGSLEALQAYSLGYQAMNVKADYKGAAPLLERAVSLDPNFAMAYGRLAYDYRNSDDYVRAAENARKAYDLRQRVSEREKFYIEAAYELIVTENLEAARKIYELWAQLYPRDDVPPNDLGLIYYYLGDHEKCLSLTKESLRLDPGSAISTANLIGAYISLNRLDDAKATIREAQAHNLDLPRFHIPLYKIAFLEHDAAGMEREANSLVGKPELETAVLYYESETAAYGGQFSRAHELARRVIETHQRAGRKEMAAAYEAQAGLRQALAGNLPLAKHQAEDALSLTDNKYIVGASAIVLGLAGDPAKSTRIADDLAHRFPENTSIQFHYIPMIRGAVAMQSGNATKAIEALALGAPYELGETVWLDYLRLYLIYLRGRAYLATHQGSPAAEEFQKILNHPGLVVNEPIGSLAHLGLGRAYAMAGDSAKAKSAYQDFLGLWKDADPDIPILKEAKAEYAKLQ